MTNEEIKDSNWEKAAADHRAGNGLATHNQTLPQVHPQNIAARYDMNFNMPQPPVNTKAGAGPLGHADGVPDWNEASR